MKHTKKALLLSCVSLLVCMSMLVGTTFAWFTDTATTGVNTIQSGNLDIKLSYKNATVSSWTEVSTSAKLFDDAALWEPGYTEVAYLKVENNGSLALKYQLTVAVSNEIVGKNKDGGDIKLSEVLKYDLIELADDTTYADRAAALEAITDAKALATESVSDSMEASATAKYYALIVYMPTAADNSANHDGANVPSIQLGVSLVATQLTNESDSFGSDYDENALFDNERMATNDAELTEALNEALSNSVIDTIYLDGSFGATMLPVNTNGLSLIAKNGATMENLNINGAKNIVIDGLTFDAAKAGQTYVNKAGGTAQLYTASIFDDRREQIAANNNTSAPKNVTIRNCTFSGDATADALGGYVGVHFDDGGAGTRAENITVENCTFNCNAFSYIYIQNIGKGDGGQFPVVIRNNTFGGEGYATTWTAVAVQQLNNVKVEITGNEFTNWDPDEGAIVVSKKSGSIAAVAVITGNTFNGEVNDNKCVIAIRRTGNTAHTISDNIYNITGRDLTDAVTETPDGNTAPSKAVAVWYRQYNL